MIACSRIPREGLLSRPRDSPRGFAVEVKARDAVRLPVLKRSNVNTTWVHLLPEKGGSVTVTSGRSSAGMSSNFRFVRVPDVEIGVDPEPERNRLRTLFELHEEGGVVPGPRRDLHRIAEPRLQLPCGSTFSQNETVPLHSDGAYGMLRAPGRRRSASPRFVNRSASPNVPAPSAC